MKSISRALLLAFILGLLAYAEETQEQQVDRLIRELQNSDSDIRSIAAVTLGEIGPEAKDAVPALIQALRDQDKHVRRDAAEALEEIGLPKAIKTAKERYRAVVTLGWIGSEDEVPALVRTLKNGNIHVPLFATWSLGVLRLMIVIGFIGISGALIITIWFVFLCGNTSFCAWKWDWT